MKKYPENAYQFLLMLPYVKAMYSDDSENLKKNGKFVVTRISEKVGFSFATTSKWVKQIIEFDKELIDIFIIVIKRLSYQYKNGEVIKLDLLKDNDKYLVFNALAEIQELEGNEGKKVQEIDQTLNQLLLNNRIDFDLYNSQQFATVIYTREEDEKSTVLIIEGDKVRTIENDDNKFNPSSRRISTSVFIKEEEDPLNVIKYSIIQHKGLTMFEIHCVGQEELEYLF